jgi:hypothetical protein
VVKKRKYLSKKLTAKKVRFATVPTYISFKEELEEGAFLTKIRKYLSKKLTAKKVRFAAVPTYITFKEELEEDYDWFEKDEFLTHVETWVGEAEPLRQQKDYISSTEGRIRADTELMKMDDAQLEAQTNLDTSQSDTFTQDKDDLIFEPASTAGHTERMKKADAALQVQINLDTSQSDTFTQDKDDLIFKPASTAGHTERMKKADAALEVQINLVTPQNVLRRNRDDLIKEAACRNSAMKAN